MTSRFQFTSSLALPRLLFRQNGFSLVELMVGVTIALIALLIITTVVINAGQQNKTTISGSDAQTTGAVASYVIERDLRMAGGGLIFPADLALASDAFCEVHAFHANEAFILSMAPVIINTQTDGSDVITVFYGNPSAGSGFSTASLAVTYTNTPTPPPSFPLNNNGVGFGPGDLFLVAPVSNATSLIGDDRPDCFMGENTAAINASPLTTNGTYVLERIAGTSQITPQYNRANGALPTSLVFSGGATGTADVVFNLGGHPGLDAQDRLTCDMGDCAVNRTYAITNNQLTMTENLLAPTRRVAWPIADNIVMLRAQYGKDTNADGTVDTWDSTLTDGVTNANGDVGVGVGDELWSQWNQVRAMRFAVVARSKTRDPAMVTATPLTLWTGETWALNDEARHYRYRVYQTIVPIRNNMWRQ